MVRAGNLESEHWILRVSSCVSEDKLASMVAQMVRNLPTMWETRVRSLGWEDPLEKGVATCSSILAWRISWTGSLVGCSPWGCKELDLTEQPPHMVFSELSWGLNEVMSMWLPSRSGHRELPREESASAHLSISSSCPTGRLHFPACLAVGSHTAGSG